MPTKLFKLTVRFANAVGEPSGGLKLPNLANSVHAPPFTEASQRIITLFPATLCVTEPELDPLQTVAAPVKVPATVAGQTLKDLELL